MPRYMLSIAYDGTEFHGWQKQARTGAALPGVADGADAEPATGSAGPEPLRTVQAVVERAVREAVREPVELLGASRTDAGVHAAAQCAAFTTTEDRRGAPDERLAAAINARLPEDVLVTRAQRAHPRFDPIGHCEAKGYRYTLRTAPERPLWDRRYVHHVYTPLDVEAMRAAAAEIVGTRDFAAFAATRHGRLTTVRTVFACEVTRPAPDTLAIDVSGDGFLYNMVRIIAGTLVDVGRGKMTAAGVREALASLDRAKAGPTLPARGLRLEWIRYPAAALDPDADLPPARRRGGASESESAEAEGDADA